MMYAEEIERAVLGACLLERSAQSTALKSLRAEMFYITAHRAVFEAIKALYAKGAAVDMLTVCEELRASGRLDEAGGAFAVAKLAGEVATSAHLEYHCAILYQYFLRRQLVEVLTRELAAANDMTCDVYDVLIDTQRELGALLDDSPLENHLHSMPEVMEDTVALVDRRQELSVNGLTGVPTGLQRLNEMTGGWQPGNLIFTAARPADGKTALDLFFARQAAMAGVPVVFFTLEMTASELGERMVLAESRADPLRIRQGKLTPEEVEDVHRTAERMSVLPVQVDDTPYINVDQLCIIAKSLRAKGELGLLIVDYLQLLATVNPGRTREQEVAECSRKLKGLARSLGCPVIVSSQLNRQAEDRAGSPELRHLRESGAIEQDADLVILLHRPERYHIRVDPDTGCSTRGMGIATLAKHRNGATGKVYYGYNPSMTKIGEFEGVHVAVPGKSYKEKKMKERSVTYSVVPRVDPRDLSAGVTYYARAQARGVVSLVDMAVRIQKRCTVTKADTLAVLTALEEEIGGGLCNGEIIRLGDIGSLQMGVKSEGVKCEADFRPSMLGKVWVHFRPGTVLKEMMDNLAFERVAPHKKVIRRKK